MRPVGPELRRALSLGLSVIGTLDGCGVYLIMSDRDPRLYVGSSIDLRHRWEKHLGRLRRGRHKNSGLQRAWDEHGPSALCVVVLAHASAEHVLTTEQLFLDAAASLDGGLFNLMLVASSRLRLGRVLVSGDLARREKERRHAAKVARRADKLAQARLIVSRPKLSREQVVERTRPGRERAAAALRAKWLAMTPAEAEAERERLRQIGVAAAMASRGRLVSKATRARLSAAAKGRKHSRESVERAAAKRRGRKTGPETVEKIRAALLARRTPDQVRRAQEREARRALPVDVRRRQAAAKGAAKLRGRKQSPERTAKIAAARRGQKQPRRKRGAGEQLRLL